jgi:hypothetical protein
MKKYFKKEKENSSLVKSNSRRLLDPHKEEVFKNARKIKYPVKRSAHKKAAISIALLLLLSIFVTGGSFYLVKIKKDYSKLSYRLSKIIPFHITEIEDSAKVLYSDYLFELRSNLFYLENIDKVNFSTEEGSKIKQDYENRSLIEAKKITWVKLQAEKLGLKVDGSEVDTRFKDLLLGTDSQIAKIGFKKYYDWEISDYKNSLKNQILEEKVLLKLDTEAQSKLDNLTNQINLDNFTTIAKEKSEGELKGQEGLFQNVTLLNTQELPTAILVAASKTNINTISAPFYAQNGIYLLKMNDKNADNNSFTFNILKIEVKTIESYVTY